MPSFDHEVVTRRQHVRAGATPGRRGPIAIDASGAARLVELLAALDWISASTRCLPGISGLIADELDPQIGELRTILGIAASDE